MTKQNFDLTRSIELLERTPKVLFALLSGLDTFWIGSASDPRDWEAFDIVGHLIHAERTDWVPRARIIIEQGPDRNFTPFDRLAQFEASKGKDLAGLLTEFTALRSESLKTLNEWELSHKDLEMLGIHPEFGEVTLRQLIATWVVHDLTHLRQINIKMARKYSDDVGPWREYLSILQ